MSRSLALKDFVFWASLVFIFPLFIACVSETGHQRGDGKASPGELIDKNTTWRGGAIGAGLSKPLEGR